MKALTSLDRLTQDLGVRQFLLTNLDRGSPSDPYRFRLPLHYLANAIGEIGNFPYQPGERVFEQPSLFLKGESSPPLAAGRLPSACESITNDELACWTGSRSKYINSRNIPLIKQFFPNSQLETLETGHWGAWIPLDALSPAGPSLTPVLTQYTPRSRRSLSSR